MSEPNIELNLTPEHLQAIGLLSARWSFLESEIDFTVSALGSLVEDDQLLPASFQKRLKLWRKLARKMYEDDKVVADNAGLLVDAAKFLHDDRCYVLHGRIFYRPTEPGVLQVESHKHRAEWRINRTITTVADIHRVIEEIERTTKELIRFNRKHLPAHPPSLPYPW